MRSGKLLFLTMALIVIAAGCTGSRGNVAFDQNAGVRIQQFSMDMNEIFAAEDVNMVLKVQNVGSKTMADDSQLWIYGPTLKSSGTDTWTTSETLTNGYISKTLPTASFTPPNVERGIPGAVDITELAVTAPAVPESMTRTDNFYARVCYPYQTEALAKIVGVSKNQMRIEPLSNTDAQTRASAGPIQIKVQSAGEMNVDRIIAGNVPLVLELNDVGGGFAVVNAVAADACTSRTPDISSKVMNKVRLTVTVDGVATSCDGSKDITISNGVGGATCKLTTGALSAAGPKTEYTVDAIATYNYVLTQSVPITVKNENL